MIESRFLYGGSHEDSHRVLRPIDSDSLLEEIYAWDAGENDVLGACSSEVGKLIQDNLVEPFAFSVSPETRCVSRFRSAVDHVLSDNSVLNEPFWSDCQETKKQKGGDDVHVRANIVLATLRQFHWVACVFFDLPQATVLIR